MKLQSFYFIAIFIYAYITFALTIEAYTTDTVFDRGFGYCKIWVEDSNEHRIAGDGPSHYGGCSVNYIKNKHQILYFPNQTFWVHAKVLDSAEKGKVRGPFNANTCFSIYGSTSSWLFDEISC
ncbi:hypothetical protein F8M41_015692 [Gigaspora margarita]|uniref:Uncharacterized protein n=1 Tax=Gigaspora margarita TaxID=4874 RepID=A0A8H3WWC3_GIGMA|nr:hypothetical protein F8M41_015692 [Gigaspora margarita]